jgi:hypothetical protein
MAGPQARIPSRATGRPTLAGDLMAQAADYRKASSLAPLGGKGGAQRRVRGALSR